MPVLLPFGISWWIMPLPAVHPLHVSGRNDAFVAHTVPMFHCPLKQISNSFDAAVWMPGKAGKIIAGVIRAEVVKEQEWVQIRNLIVSESTLKMDAGSLNSGFTFPRFIDLPRHALSFPRI